MPIQNGLQFRLSLDGNDSGTTASAGASFVVDGNKGTVLDGSAGGIAVDNFEGLYTPAIVASGKMTVSFWAKFSEADAIAGGVSMMWSKSPYRNTAMFGIDGRAHMGNTRTLNTGIYTMSAGSNLNATHNGMLLYSGGILIDSDPGTNTVNYDEWMHISLVFYDDNYTIKTYIDGELVTDQTDVNWGGHGNNWLSAMTNGVAFTVGSDPSYSGNFPGLIYDFMVHDRELSAAEVTEAMNSALTPNVELTYAVGGLLAADKVMVFADGKSLSAGAYTHSDGELVFASPDSLAVGNKVQIIKVK